MNVKYMIAGFLLALFIGGGAMIYVWFTSEVVIDDEEVKEIAAAPYELEESDQPTSVKNEYESLMTEAESRILALEENAMEDMNGETSYLELYQKYSAAAEELEDHTDETFESLHQQLLEEGMEDEAAFLKQQYESRKEEWRQSIVEEVERRMSEGSG
ncbi:hypothetical protein U0355_03970 [Salimicrobium sp. PL1-032A]|uniref:hypothetical protein n=1 Tax=Salimicrobium sp. PL1-032A TaxID=3095364 RepID=UPI003260F19A